MFYVAYLDEFGHVGPYISRVDPSYKTSPIFGLGGIVLPSNNVREFATWFFQRKNELLSYELLQSNEHPAKWEKKGAALYTTKNITKYPELRSTTNRIMNKILSLGGFLFYHGLEKTLPPDQSNSEHLYSTVLRHTIIRLNKHMHILNADFMIVIDESEGRFHHNVIIKQASVTMFGTDYCKRLIEPPVQVKSHLFQTIQAADWACALLGRLGAYRSRPDEWPDFCWAETYFGKRVDSIAVRSSIHKANPPKD